MNDWSGELKKNHDEKTEADEKIEIEKDHDDLDPGAEIVDAKRRKNGIEVVPEIENQKVTENGADPGNAAGSDQNRQSDDEKSADRAAETKEKFSFRPNKLSLVIYSFDKHFTLV